MSQELVSQRIKRTCEGCGVVKEWELVNMPQESIDGMQNWYTVIREVFVPVEGRFVKMMVQACSLACVPTAAIKLALPKYEEPDDTIDLASLRTSSSTPLN